MDKLNSWIKRNGVTLLAFSIVMATAAVFHTWNMLQYPFFENDEGTYLAQAWSFVSDGKLAPYTYWYDHAPFGWMLIAAWLKLTGGLFTFGFSMNSGRILMLVIHLLNAAMLFAITKKITKSNFAAVVSGVFFSVSPIAVYFQRRLLLDNLMTFWLLVSTTLILYARGKMSRFIASAIAFALAVLSKENAAFFLPALAWLTWRESFKMSRWFVVFKWLAIGGLVISTYPLYALLKNELFPATGLSEHVSLLGTLGAQAARGSGLPFWTAGSDFLVNVQYWLFRDPLLVIAGAVAICWAGIAAIRSAKYRAVFFLTLPMVAFLMSGRLVINFYIVPLVPFMAIAVGTMWSDIVRIAGKRINVIGAAVAVLMAIGLIAHYSENTKEYLTRDETSRQVEAINWVKKNVDPKAYMAIDFYGYSDLRFSRFEGDPEFKNADWFWKVELDPDIKVGKLKNDHTNLDYILMTAEVQRQLKGFNEKTSIMRNALPKSEKIKEFAFESDFAFKPELYTQNYPNGDWVVVYKQTTPEKLLTETWSDYKKTFITFEGQVVDESRALTTSEGQSYAMLRAVWINDQEIFDLVWKWTKENLQRPDKIFAWKYGNNQVLDPGSAADGDVDIALALILAGKRWGDEQYTNQAREVVYGIGEEELWYGNTHTLVVAGNWARDKSTGIFNPSYAAPYAYRLFAEIDPAHNWGQVVNDTYDALRKCIHELDGASAAPIPPDWCEIDNRGNAKTSSVEGLNSTNYGYDAVRVPLRVGIDYAWYGDPRAKNLLTDIGVFMAREWTDNGNLATEYDHRGVRISDYESRFAYITNIFAMEIVDPIAADDVYKRKVSVQLSDEEKNNYYLQNLLWFSRALKLGVVSKY